MNEQREFDLLVLALTQLDHRGIAALRADNAALPVQDRVRPLRRCNVQRNVRSHPRRIFFYVNGFRPGDGGLLVVPGSHLFRQGRLNAASDEELRAAWLDGKAHPETGEPLAPLDLEAPPGSVIVMWTHALHAVSPRRDDSAPRWAVVYAYRNPGAPSHARWVTPAFEAAPPPGAEGLMALDLS